MSMKNVLYFCAEAQPETCSYKCWAGVLALLAYFQVMMTPLVARVIVSHHSSIQILTFHTALEHMLLSLPR